MIRFTNPTVEALANSLCDSHMGDKNLKLIGPKDHRIKLMSDASPEYQDMLLRQAEELEKAAKAYRSAHAFNDMAIILGTEVEE